MRVYRWQCDFIHNEQTNPEAFRDGGIVTLDMTLSALFQPHKILAASMVGKDAVHHRKASEILMVAFKDWRGKTLHEVRGPEVRDYKDDFAILEFPATVPLAVKFTVVVSVKPGIAWYGTMFGECRL